MYEWHNYRNNSDSLNHINNIKAMKHIGHIHRKFEDLILSNESTEGNVLFVFNEL